MRLDSAIRALLGGFTGYWSRSPYEQCSIDKCARRGHMQVKPDNPRRDQFILCTVHAAKVRDEYFFRSGKKPCAYLGVCKLNPFGLWFLCNGKCEYYKPWAPSRKSCYHCKANIVCKDYEALPEEIDGKADTCAYYDPT